MLMWSKVEAALIPVSAALSFIVTHWLGGWTPPLVALVSLSTTDYVTGVLAAGAEAKRAEGDGVSSKKATRGLLKKIVILAFVGVGHRLDEAFGHGPVIASAVSYWFMSVELISITENAGRLGVPIPPALVAVLSVLRSKGGETSTSAAPIGAPERKEGGAS